MGAPTRFGIFCLQPAYAPERAVTRVGALPFGGPTDGSGYFPQGRLLGAVRVAAQSEVVTLSFTGGATGGTFALTITLDKAYVISAIPYNVSLAALQALIVAAIPEFSGNFTITGTASTSGTGGTYTCTFNTNLANQRIGGLWAVSTALTGGSSPAGAWARTTRGSCGLNQLDLYDASANDYVDAVLKYDTYLSPGGSVITPGHAAAAFTSANQPNQPTVYVSGIFKVSDLVGVDADAYATATGALIKKDGGINAELL